MSLVVVMALRAEAMPVVDRLGLEALPPWESMPWVEAYGSSDGRVRIVVNGVDPLHGVDSIGTTAGALTAAVAIERFEPTWVVSAGTAGGFASRGGRVGQVIVASGPIIHHDRRVDLEGYDSFARGEYPTANLAAEAELLGFNTGPCSSGDSLDAPPQDIAAMQAHGTVAKDMEAAAVAGVAARAGCQFTALKVITDIVDGPEPTVEEFLSNLAHAGQVLGTALPQLLDVLSTSLT